MGGAQAKVNPIEAFAQITEPIVIPSEQQELIDLMSQVSKTLQTDGKEAIALFLTSYPQCLRLLLDITKHQNATPEIFTRGFEILSILAENQEAIKAFMTKGGIEFLLKFFTSYDYRKRAKVMALKQAIDLMLKMLKNDVLNTKKVIAERGFINLMSPIIMETKVLPSEKERMELIRSACQLYSELTHIRDHDLMESIVSETGIVPNFVLLLTESQDGATLDYALRFLAHISILPEVQQNIFLIKNGVSAVLSIIEKNGSSCGVQIQTQASMTLLQFCSSKNKDLQASLKANNTIEKLLDIISLEKDEGSTLSFFCKLCLLELCHSPENQSVIEREGGVEHFLSLAFFEPKSLSEKSLFASTLLQFTKRSSWIQISEIFPYFVKIIVKNLQLTQSIKTFNKKTETQVESANEQTDRKGAPITHQELRKKKELIEKQEYSNIQKYSLEALRNISLNSYAHKEIFKNDSLAILIPYLNKISDLINQLRQLAASPQIKTQGNEVLADTVPQMIESVFTPEQGELTLTVIKALNNCLMNEEVRYALNTNDETHTFKSSLTNKYLAFLHTFHVIAEEDQLLSRLCDLDESGNLETFLWDLQNECTLALLMLETSSIEGDFVFESYNDEGKIQFLVDILKNDNNHFICKALNILTQLARKWPVTLTLFQKEFIQGQKGIVSQLKALLSQDEPSIAREAFNLISQMLSNPDELQVWLKLDSSNVCVNSSSSDDFMILQAGDPKRLPVDRGIYRNWGAFFDEGDILSLSNGGLGFPTDQWTITAWITLPIVKFKNSGRRHVLVQPISGKGIHLMVDETGSRLGSIDEISGLFIDSMIDLTKYSKGWHHIAVTCDNSDNEKSVTFYIDGSNELDSSSKTAAFDNANKNKLGGAVEGHPQTNESKPTLPTQGEKKQLHLTCKQPIGYIGNSSKGLDPFGTFADLRIYSRILSEQQIIHQSKYHEDQELEMPDMYLMKFYNEAFIELLIEQMKIDLESTAISAIKALTKFASKKECKAKILSLNGLKIAIELLTGKSQTASEIYKLELSKLLYNLN